MCILRNNIKEEDRRSEDSPLKMIVDSQICGTLNRAPYPRLQKERETSESLLKLEQEYNVCLEQINGQRHLRHADSSVPAPTDDKCEVFVGKLPRDIFEDELYPLFAQCGEIYEVRLMMDFSGSNRGFCFIKYRNEADAKNAVRKLNRYEIKPGHMIGVIMSTNNSKLNIGNLPSDLSVEEIIKEFINIKREIKRVSVFKDLQKRYRYAIITYQTHRDAAMARREFAPRKTNLFGKIISVDWAEPGFKPDNVIEEAAEIRKDGEIVLEQPVIIESKNQFNKVLKPGHRSKSDNKSRVSDTFNQNKPQRNSTIREQKLTEMTKKKIQKSQIRKKNQKTQALDSDEFADKFNGLKIDSNSNFEYNGDRYDSSVASSCKSSLVSDTASDPATSTANFSLFEEFTFSRPANARSCQESFQYAEHPEDDFCSNFENCSCFEMKKYDEGSAQFYQHDYAQAYSQNLQYELNQHQPTPNYYQHFRDYNDHPAPMLYSNGNSVFQYSQTQEEHQPPTASFAPKLNVFPDLEKRCASPVYYNPHNEVYTPSYIKPSNINHAPYIRKTSSTLDTSFDMIKGNSYQKNATCSFKHIPSVRSVGYPSRRSQAFSSSNWTGRIIQNESGQIPAGARPILRSHD